MVVCLHTNNKKGMGKERNKGIANKVMNKLKMKGEHTVRKEGGERLPVFEIEGIK